MSAAVQFSSVAQSCTTLCDLMNRSTPGFPVHHQLPEFTQTHVHWVGDAIQPSHPLLSPATGAVPTHARHVGTDWDDSTFFFFSPLPRSAWCSKTHPTGWRRPSPPGCRWSWSPTETWTQTWPPRPPSCWVPCRISSPNCSACRPTTETAPTHPNPGGPRRERAGGTPQGAGGKPRAQTFPGTGLQPPSLLTPQRAGPALSTGAANPHLTRRRQTRPGIQEGKFSLE